MYPTDSRWLDDADLDLYGEAIMRDLNSFALTQNRGIVLQSKHTGRVVGNARWVSSLRLAVFNRNMRQAASNVEETTRLRGGAIKSFLGVKGAADLRSLIESDVIAVAINDNKHWSVMIAFGPGVSTGGNQLGDFDARLGKVPPPEGTRPPRIRFFHFDSKRQMWHDHVAERVCRDLKDSIALVHGITMDVECTSADARNEFEQRDSWECGYYVLVAAAESTKAIRHAYGLERKMSAAEIVDDIFARFRTAKVGILKDDIQAVKKTLNGK
jgi:hypothetical protein